MGNLRPAHRGYVYQDVLSTYLVLKYLLCENVKYEIDKKDLKEDSIDDLKIYVKQLKLNFQIKHSENKVFELNDIKKEGKISLYSLYNYFIKDRTSNPFYYFMLKWKFPIDDLKEWLIEVQNDAFQLKNITMYKLNLDYYDDIVNILSLNVGIDIRDFFNKIFFCIETPNFSGEFGDFCGDLEEQIVELARKIGIGSYPNENMDPNVFSMQLCDMIMNSRSTNKYNFSNEEIINKFRIINNYGKVDETFEIDLGHYLNQKNKISNVIKIIEKNEKTIVSGSPGSGKSHLVHGIIEALNQKNIKNSCHYFFSNLLDEDSTKRLTFNSMIGNILSSIYEDFPEIKNEINSYAVSIDILNRATDKIKEPYYLIIDGVDHAFRNYNFAHTHEKLIASLKEIKTNEYVHVLVVSQPIKELSELDKWEIYSLENWSYEEVKDYLSRFSNLKDESEFLKVYNKCSGNPLYLSYIANVEHGNQIDNFPIYSNDISDYYQYIIEKKNFSFFQFLVSIPFYFSKEEFIEMTNLGEEALCFFKNIKNILVYSAINKGYKIYHESLKKYIYDQCYNRGLDLSKSKKIIGEWLYNKGFYDNEKAYLNMFDLFYDCEEFGKIVEFCEYDFLIKSNSKCYSAREVKHNVDIMKKSVCKIKSYDSWIKYALINKALENYYDDDFLSYSYIDFFKASLALDNSIFNRLINKEMGASTKNNLLFSASINNIEIFGFNFDEYSYNEYERNTSLMLLVINEVKKKKESKIKLTEELSYSELDDIYYSLAFLPHKINIYSEINKNILFINSCNIENIVNVALDYDFSFEFGDSVYKYNFDEALIQYINFFDVYWEDKSVFEKCLSLENSSFFHSLLAFILKMKVNYKKFKVSNNLNDYENISIENLKHFSNIIDAFSGKPRACDFYGKVFSSIFIKQLLFPLSLIKSKIKEYFTLVLFVEEKIGTSVRGTKMSCISFESILENLIFVLNGDNYKAIIELSEQKLEKESLYQIYSYTAESCFKLSWLYSKFDKIKANEFYLKGIEYCFTYGFRKDIFLDDVLDTLELGLIYDKESFENELFIVGNMCYNIAHHTDGSGTKSFYIDWLNKYSKYSLSNALTFIIMQQLKEGYYWKNNDSLCQIISSNIESFDLNLIRMILQLIKGDSSNFDENIYIDIYEKMTQELDTAKSNQFLAYLVSISNCLGKETQKKLNKILLNKNIQGINVTSDFNYSDKLKERKYEEITIDKFYNSDYLGSFSTKSIIKLLEDNNFTNIFIDQLIKYFNTNVHEIDRLEQVFESASISDDKKIWLYILFFVYKKDGWYKSFLHEQYYYAASSCNSELAEQRLFYVLSKAKSLFHGFTGIIKILPNDRTGKYNKIKICDLVLENAKRRIPDCVPQISKEEFITNDLNELLVCLIIVCINMFDLDSNCTALSFLKELLNDNKYNIICTKFLKKHINEFNLTAQIQIVDLLIKSKINISDFEFDFKVVECMKYNKIDYYSMINISNFSELEKAAIIYAYDFETIARFCEKYEIKFSNIVDEFHEKRNKIEGYDLYYSRSTLRPIDNYCLYNIYLESLEKYISKAVSNNELSIQDVSGLIRYIKPQNEDVFLSIHNFDINNDDFICIAEYSSEEIEGTKEFLKENKRINIKQLDTNLIVSNINYLSQHLSFSKNIIIKINPDCLFLLNLIECIEDNRIVYYSGGELVGYLYINKYNINSLQDYCDRYYNNEIGKLYISKKLYKKLKLNKLKYKNEKIVF